MRTKRKQLPWMKTVQVGDVIISGRGTYRIVRHVSRFSDGDLRSVDLAILRCSWTERPYTVLGYTDLCNNKYSAAGVQIKLDAGIDKLLEQHINNPNLRSLCCCDVKGIR